MGRWNFGKHILFSLLTTVLIFVASILWFNYKCYGKVAFMDLDGTVNVGFNIGIAMIAIGCLVIFAILLAVYQIAKIFNK